MKKLFIENIDNINWLHVINGEEEDPELILDSQIACDILYILFRDGISELRRYCIDNNL